MTSADGCSTRNASNVVAVNWCTSAPPAVSAQSEPAPAGAAAAAGLSGSERNATKSAAWRAKRKPTVSLAFG